MNKGMIRTAFILLFGLTLVFTQTTQALTKAPTISLTDEKVIYNLPHSGILPDHPFYFLKQLRDGITDFTTRDPMKKASLYLLYSDKHMVMAMDLADKGKEQLSVRTLTTGEEYFLKIVPLLETSKKQGVSPEAEFLNKLKNSNIKHREVIDTMLKKLNQGERESLTNVLQLNQKAREQLESFK